MISRKKLDKIKKLLMKYGEGKFLFNTKDIEELLTSYEELLIDRNEQRRIALQYSDEKQDRLRRAHELEMSRM